MWTEPGTSPAEAALFASRTSITRVSGLCSTRQYASLGLIAGTAVRTPTPVRAHAAAT
ncbi:MAG TPA: hypothetical protein VK902_24165 [Rubrobacter sp.]|nr:hypothetical protein [Rubrobacter sp.]